MATPLRQTRATRRPPAAPRASAGPAPSPCPRPAYRAMPRRPAVFLATPMIPGAYLRWSGGSPVDDQRGGIGTSPPLLPRVDDRPIVAVRFRFRHVDHQPANHQTTWITAPGIIGIARNRAITAGMRGERTARCGPSRASQSTGPMPIRLARQNREADPVLRVGERPGPMRAVVGTRKEEPQRNARQDHRGEAISHRGSIPARPLQVVIRFRSRIHKITIHRPIRLSETAPLLRTRFAPPRPTLRGS